MNVFWKRIVRHVALFVLVNAFLTQNMVLSVRLDLLHRHTVRSDYYGNKVPNVFSAKDPKADAFLAANPNVVLGSVIYINMYIVFLVSLLLCCCFAC